MKLVLTKVFDKSEINYLRKYLSSPEASEDDKKSLYAFSWTINKNLLKKIVPLYIKDSKILCLFPSNIFSSSDKEWTFGVIEVEDDRVNIMNILTGEIRQAMFKE